MLFELAPIKWIVGIAAGLGNEDRVAICGELEISCVPESGSVEGVAVLFDIL